MAKENQLSAVIHNINTKEYYYFTVYDNDKKELLYELYPATEILIEFESGEKFFAHLKSKGNINLKLTFFTKKNKRKIKQTTTFDVNLKSEPKKMPHVYVFMPKATEPVPTKFENKIPVEMKPNDLLKNMPVGLSLIASNAILENDIKHLKTENNELKAENQRMEQRHNQTREDFYKRQYETDKKHSNGKFSNSVLGAIIVNIPNIIDCINQISPNRLHSPANLNYGSEVKNRFSKFILTIDDKALLFIMSIMTILKTNESFESELFQLTKKYNVYY